MEGDVPDAVLTAGAFKGLGGVREHGTVTMANEIQTYSLVALLEDEPAVHFDTGRALTLRRGQLGTVVMKYDGGGREVEFADSSGRAFAIVTLAPSKLMLLRESPDYATA